jgi:hypothetical protein
MNVMREIAHICAISFQRFNSYFGNFDKKALIIRTHTAVIAIKRVYHFLRKSSYQYFHILLWKNYSSTRKKCGKFEENYSFPRKSFFRYEKISTFIRKRRNSNVKIL